MLPTALHFLSLALVVAQEGEGYTADCAATGFSPVTESIPVTFSREFGSWAEVRPIKKL
jgi:hypothetical protein